MHIMVRIQILVTEHLVIGREYFYHSHRRLLIRKDDPACRTGLAEINRLGPTTPDGETVAEKSWHTNAKFWQLKTRQIKK